jgi:hypothetical protein
MLIRARTQSKRISVMKKYMMMPAGAFIEGEALGKEAQSERRSETPLPEDSRERHHEDLLFTGDHDPLDAVDSTPPFTWTLMWRGYYSNYYGYCVPGAMRRWGYIMWDKGRLERNDALSVLDRQWDLEEFSAGPWGWVVV